MAETRDNRDPHYEETTAPENPPNSMVNPTARTTWWGSSVGILAIVFLIVVAGFGWVLVQREFRGVGDRPQGPTSLNADDITDAGAVKNAPAGSRVRLTNVAVERADGHTGWIRCGDTTLAVITPGESTTVSEAGRSRWIETCQL